MTFRREILKHPGIQPGDRIELDLLPDGRAALKAAKLTKTIDDFLGLLAGKTNKVATLEELEKAAAMGGQVSIKIQVVPLFVVTYLHKV